MNIEKLNALEMAIQEGKFHPDCRHFAGAGLIISNDPDRGRLEGDEIVFSSSSSELSWVIFELKEVFASHIDNLTKLGFYPAVGRAANRAIRSGAGLQDIQSAMVQEAKDFWSNRQLIS
jgi:hypothetical protein